MEEGRNVLEDLQFLKVWKIVRFYPMPALAICSFHINGQL